MKGVIFGLGLMAVGGLAADDGTKLTLEQPELARPTAEALVDSDGDGLFDQDETAQHGTDPLKSDSDDDGLNDRDEILRHRTDPRDADSDDGAVGDMVEVERGTDPLWADDDVLPTVYFDLDSDSLSAETRRRLDGIVAVLTHNKNIGLVIEGHTDAQGNAEYNEKLSRRRTEVVVAYLIERRIGAARLETLFHGENKPHVANETEAQRRLNRRVDFFYK